MLGCANKDLWGLCTPISIIVVYSKSATRNNWYQSYNSTIIEIGAQRPQSGPIAWPSTYRLLRYPMNLRIGCTNSQGTFTLSKVSRTLLKKPQILICPAQHTVRPWAMDLMFQPNPRKNRSFYMFFSHNMHILLIGDSQICGFQIRVAAKSTYFQGGVAQGLTIFEWENLGCIL